MLSANAGPESVTTKSGPGSRSDSQGKVRVTSKSLVNVVEVSKRRVRNHSSRATSAKSLEREHSPEPLNPSDSEEEGTSPLVRSHRNPSQREDFDDIGSGLHPVLEHARTIIVRSLTPVKRRARDTYERQERSDVANEGDERAVGCGDP